MAEVDALLERLAEEREAVDRRAAEEALPLPGPETGDDTDPSASAH
jgi:hypothetical protein